MEVSVGFLPNTAASAERAQQAAMNGNQGGGGSLSLTCEKDITRGNPQLSQKVKGKWVEGEEGDQILAINAS